MPPCIEQSCSTLGVTRTHAATAQTSNSCRFPKPSFHTKVGRACSHGAISLEQPEPHVLCFITNLDDMRLYLGKIIRNGGHECQRATTRQGREACPGRFAIRTSSVLRAVRLPACCPRKDMRETPATAECCSVLLASGRAPFLLPLYSCRDTSATCAEIGPVDPGQARWKNSEGHCEKKEMLTLWQPTERSPNNGSRGLRK